MDKDNPHNKRNLESYNQWKSIGFFGTEDYFHFVLKKTEKITAALYLVSSLLKDTEPLKWELREKGVAVVSSTIMLNGVDMVDKNSITQSIFSGFFEMLTLLNVAVLSGLVSDMNYRVLTREIEDVVALLKDKISEDTTRAGYILSDTFFKTDKMAENTEHSTSNDKGHNKGLPHITTSHTSVHTPSHSQAGRHSSENLAIKPHIDKKEKVAIKDKKNDRKIAILELLRQGSKLTIKDFVKSISGCSEKTVQRELLNLVEKGIIKKEGERRWSTYSLA